MRPDPSPKPRSRRLLHLAAFVAVVAALGVVAHAEWRKAAYQAALEADVRRRGQEEFHWHLDDWPVDAFRGPVREARVPAAAERVVPDEDSVSYLLAREDGREILLQVFHFRLRHGRMEWPRVMVATYDGEPAQRMDGGARVEGGGVPIGREQAFSWFERREAEGRAWRTAHADSLERLVERLTRVSGTWERWQGRWNFGEADLLRPFDAIVTDFHDVGVARLVECVGDVRPSATRVGRGEPGEGEVVPVGALCHAVLERHLGPSQRALGRRGGHWPRHLGEDERLDAPRLRQAQETWRELVAPGESRYYRRLGALADE